MKRKYLVLVVVILSLAGSRAMAQSSASVVKVSVPPTKVKRGGSAVATVTLNIDGGYHINSNRPSEEFLIATALKLEPLSGVKLTPVVYPRAKMQKFSFSPKPISVFDGQVNLKFTTRALTIAAGAHMIRGKLTIQACNDEACLRPQTVDVQIPIEVQ